MKTQLRLAAALFTALLCVSAFAQKAVGSWSGKIDFSGVKARNPQESSMIEQGKKMMEGKVLKLVIKADKTYTMTFPADGGKMPPPETGKWSQKGATITLLDAKGKPTNGTISANGKKMVLTPPTTGGAPQGLKAIFTRS